ncbi:MAG: FGGY-family carbohydrate kinase [Clostridia bacterium]|nr:FGGY-family carbohydrate kinase [Clostridia bacterium]
MSMNEISSIIVSGQARLGVEFGSTRIKAVLVDPAGNPIATGGHDWENKFENGIWTYDLADVWTGLQHSYAELVKDVQAKYGCEITTLAAIGISGMMHGYIVVDADRKQLVPFRTWRNTITEQAAGLLTREFNFNIPQRWSIAHLYQSILNGEPHVKDISYLSTLAAYVHWFLTGEQVIGIGEAAGMFPIDSTVNDYDAGMIEKFDRLIADKGFGWKLRDILPKVLVAGEKAGVLSAAGAKMIDPSGTLKPGIPLCPPEGDAGTGMVATNSVRQRTGNVSAGTSVFAMIVLERALKAVHPEIDMVTTPAGAPVAMVHCNNCTSDLNAWVKLFGEFAEAAGIKLDNNTLYGTLYRKAMEADADLGGLLAYNYFSGEHVTGFNEGRPLFARMPDSRFSLANFMRTHLNSSLASLKIGMNILLKDEGVEVDSIMGHGGLFKTRGVGQNILAAALNAPVSVMETAGEGGPWGVALLASYMVDKQADGTLDDYLEERVFGTMSRETVDPDPADVAAFDAFIERYEAGLPIERAAVDSLKL